MKKIMFIANILFFIPTKMKAEDDYVEDAYTNDYEGNDNEVEYEYDNDVTEYDEDYAYDYTELVTEKIFSPNEKPLEEAVSLITNGLALKYIPISKTIQLTTPEIPENRVVVPISVEVNKPISMDSSVKSIHILNEKEPNTRCIHIFYLYPSEEKTLFFTRIKLSKSQNVLVLVELKDGSFIKMTNYVKVVYGCSG
jgi:predicted secreted protein